MLSLAVLLARSYPGLVMGSLLRFFFFLFFFFFFSCLCFCVIYSDLLFLFCSVDGVVDDLPPIAAASMWTRKDFKEFKDSLRKDKDSVIKIGSGETVTVSTLFAFKRCQVCFFAYSFSLLKVQREYFISCCGTY